MNDLIIIYYTANVISDYFMTNTQNQLLKAAGKTPIVSVSFKPMNLGKNICVGELERSPYNIYKQILIGAKAAKTKFVATAEDDVLYSPEHFQYRPAQDVFAYDTNKWSLYTWDQPPYAGYSYHERKNMTCLIVSRQALIKTLEERYTKYPDQNTYPIKWWGEPGRYDEDLGVTPVKSEKYKAKVPSIVFSTEDALGFIYLGTRKRRGKMRTDVVEPWGNANNIVKLYKSRKEEINE